MSSAKLEKEKLAKANYKRNKVGGQQQDAREVVERGRESLEERQFDKQEVEKVEGLTMERVEWLRFSVLAVLWEGERVCVSVQLAEGFRWFRFLVPVRFLGHLGHVSCLCVSLSICLSVSLLLGLICFSCYLNVRASPPSLWLAISLHISLNIANVDHQLHR